MSDKITNNPTPVKIATLFSDEIEKAVKGTINQAEKITDSTNKTLVADKLMNEKIHFDSPLLRAPEEQQKSKGKIDLESGSKDKIANYPNKPNQDRTSLLKETYTNSEKLAKTIGGSDNPKHLYGEHKQVDVSFNQPIPDNKSNTLQSAPTKTTQTANDPNATATALDKKSNDNYDYLFLQLSYQGLIHQNILDKIKDTDKYDYYLDKLNQFSKDVGELKKDFQSVVDDIKKYKEAFTDFWMEAVNQVKEKKFKTADEVKKFFNNNNIPDSLINAILKGNIKNKSDMEKQLNQAFPKMDLSKDVSDCSLEELGNLYNNSVDFSNNASSRMPNIALDKDKLASISSHKTELNNLINKKPLGDINSRLSGLKKTFISMTSVQSKIELEIQHDTLSGMALLTFLLAVVRELTMKVMLMRSEGDQKLFDEMQEVTTKTLKDKIADQKEQIRKQEEIQKWMGIGMKILGGLLAFIGAVASIFTAGASLALIAISVTLLAVDVALTVADEIHKSITGSSFMDDLMKPVAEFMNDVINKIAEFVFDSLEKLTDGLGNLGIDKAAMKEIKAAMEKAKDKIMMSLKIILMAVMLIGAIALSFVGGALADGVGRVANKIFTEQVKAVMKKMLHESLEAMLGKMIKKIILDAINSVLKQLNKLLAKQLTGNAAKILNRMLTMAQFSKSAASSSVNIYSATITEKIMKSVADTKKLDAIFKITQDLMDKSIGSQHEIIDKISDLLNEFSQQFSASNKSKANMARNLTMQG